MRDHLFTSDGKQKNGNCGPVAAGAAAAAAAAGIVTALLQLRAAGAGLAWRSGIFAAVRGDALCSVSHALGQLPTRSDCCSSHAARCTRVGSSPLAFAPFSQRVQVSFGGGVARGQPTSEEINFAPIGQGIGAALLFALMTRVSLILIQYWLAYAHRQGVRLSRRCVGLPQLRIWRRRRVRLGRRSHSHPVALCIGSSAGRAVVWQSAAGVRRRGTPLPVDESNRCSAPQCPPRMFGARSRTRRRARSPVRSVLTQIACAGTLLAWQTRQRVRTVQRCGAKVLGRPRRRRRHGRRRGRLGRAGAARGVLRRGMLGVGGDGAWHTLVV